MNDMNAKARALTDSLLANLGGAGFGKQANATIIQSDQMIGDQLANQPATPRTGESVTGTLQQLILQGIASGAVDNDLAEGGSGQYPAAPNGAAMGSVGESPEVQKVAAISDFVNRGYSVDQAYDLLKSAEANMEHESENMQKAAMISQLVSEGASVEEAAWAIKAAEDHEADMIVKQAQAGAMSALVEQGLDPMSAAQYVEASTQRLFAQA